MTRRSRVAWGTLFSTPPAFVVALLAVLAGACGGTAAPEESASVPPPPPPSPSPSPEPAPVVVVDDGPYRPVVHYTPRQHWMNDPNGPILLDGRYHLYYQYNPNGPLWGDISWGHAISDDLVVWEEQAVALPADPPNLVFSGSAIVDTDDASGLCGPEATTASCVLAFYTGHRIDPATTLTRQDQRVAVSRDGGSTFTPYAGNPVIDYELVDFRDPNVFWHDESASWIMVIALPIERQVVIFRSTDLISWEETSRFGPTGVIDGVWECPVLFRLPVVDAPTGDDAPAGDDVPPPTRWVMKVDHNPGHVTGGSGSQYFVGEFDGRTFVPDEWQAPPRWVDWGPDFYCAMPFTDEPVSAEGRTWIAWMSNWEYASDTPTAPWRGAMSLPRRVALATRDGRPTLVQTPIETLDAHEGPPTRLEGVPAGDAARLLEGRELPPAYRLRLDIALGDATSVTLALGTTDPAAPDGAAPALLLTYDRESGTLTVDRSAFAPRLGPAFGRSHTAPLPLDDTATLRLDIVVDRSSVEVFADGGAVVFTELVFPDPGRPGATLRWSGPGEPGPVTLDLRALGPGVSE